MPDADGDGQHSIEDINRVYDTLLEKNNTVLGVRDFGKLLKSIISISFSAHVASLMSIKIRKMV